MILLRTVAFTDETMDFARCLARASRREVAILIDERQGKVDTGPYPKVSVNAAVCRELGLHTPDDFAWCCGDYGFYLARRQFGSVDAFWMIEHDVRIAGASDFFALTDRHPDFDLLAAKLMPADADWWWRPNVAALDAQSYRCFFPVVRLSSRAIDVLHAKRAEQSRKVLRRLLWPNDESFVTTAVVHAGLSFADLNSLGRSVYDDARYGFRNVMDLAQFTYDDSICELFHPLLSGRDYQAKVARLQSEDIPPSLKVRLSRRYAPALLKHRPW